MKKIINFGIGFISGRPNVCKIINNYGNYITEQLKELKDVEVNITIYILYDLNYQQAMREDFYSISSKVYKNIKIKYITPENIREYEKILISRYKFKKTDARLFIGNGYAKARNTILYCAMQHNMDYILFWDDDEYPVANIKDGEKLVWIKQKNILEHIKNIESVEITMGYRCGMMNPIPYIHYTDEIKEEDYKNFIDALENEVINWEKIQKNRKNQTCISYAKESIAKGNILPKLVEGIGINNFVLGSGICLNLKRLDKIPAFYNPPEARGEDTFFSCSLKSKGAQILSIPTYHFHDSFLQFPEIMTENYPTELINSALGDVEIQKRFLKATIGWIRYKPLFYYIKDNKNYKKIIEKTRENLKKSVKKMNTSFQMCDFSCLIDELNLYDKNVEKHYKEYLRVNELWDMLKYKIRKEEQSKNENL